MKWQKKLNKKELAHFKFATHGDMTLIAFKQNREAQNKMRAESRFPDSEVCNDCWTIAHKLGLE